MGRRLETFEGGGRIKKMETVQTRTVPKQSGGEVDEGVGNPNGPHS